MGVIKIKSGTIDFVREGNPHAKFGNRLLDASPHMGEM